jgi:poly(ADP-ribose) glycohydrolase
LFTDFHLFSFRLFTERLEDNEVLIIRGFERYSNYSGYASTFEFTGDHKQPLLAFNQRFPSSLVAMDALHFRASPIQFRQDNIVRELNKAYVGFYKDTYNE